MCFIRKSGNLLSTYASRYWAGSLSDEEVDVMFFGYQPFPHLIPNI